MGASIRIPVTLVPRTDHHADLHPDMILPKEVIFDDGTDPLFEIRNETDKPSYLFLCWDRVGGPVPPPPDHDHSHHNTTAANPASTAAAPAVAHARPKHGEVASAAYDHVICAHCMEAEGLDFDSVIVPPHDSAQLTLKRKLIEPRRGTRPDGSHPIELRQVYLGTLYRERDQELHQNNKRPTDKQLGWLFFIEHPFLDPPHPNHEHRHHSENVILESW